MNNTDQRTDRYHQHGFMLFVTCVLSFAAFMFAVDLSALGDEACRTVPKSMAAQQVEDAPAIPDASNPRLRRSRYAPFWPKRLPLKSRQPILTEMVQACRQCRVILHFRRKTGRIRKDKHDFETFAEHICSRTRATKERLKVVIEIGHSQS
ncbi:hypothetical protein HGG75_07450 [Ochrobactrum pseudogrignonense]|nr:hypothetical protein [Brucella pseudogrignonensis]